MKNATANSTGMVLKKKSEFYSDEELKKITEQWLEDKARIDADLTYGYYWDRDKEYERHLNNANLRALFRSVIRLLHGMKSGEQLHLYPREIPLIPEVYRRIVKDGYYSPSKKEEKRVRAWIGKAVSRQYWKKYGRS